MPTFNVATIGVAASRILAADAQRKSYVIVNRGTASVFFGNDDTVGASAATGFQVEPGQAFSGEDDPTDEIWAISTVAGQTLNVATIP